MRCGLIWACPVCSVALRAQRLGKLDRAIRGDGGRWQLVTLTVRHDRTMPLRDTLGGLMGAWRRTRQGGAVQRLWTAHVRASARATEVTWGRNNGWHPHLHVLLATDEWSGDERKTLLERWRRIVSDRMGARCAPSAHRAIRWSDPLDAATASETDRVKRARYLVKLGSEIALDEPKDAKRGHATAWGLARRAAAGHPWSQRLWGEYCAATKGRRALELDDRAAALADRLTPVAGETGPNTSGYVRVPLAAWELAQLGGRERAGERTALLAPLRAVVQASDPAAAVRDAIHPPRDA